MDTLPAHGHGSKAATAMLSAGVHLPRRPESWLQNINRKPTITKYQLTVQTQGQVVTMSTPEAEGHVYHPQNYPSGKSVVLQRCSSVHALQHQQWTKGDAHMARRRRKEIKSRMPESIAYFAVRQKNNNNNNNSSNNNNK